MGGQHQSDPRAARTADRGRGAERCINANKALVWPAANAIGSYDIVADFGNNDPNPMAFVKDGSYDTPQDMIDGYFTPGFRIVADPGTISDFPNIGSFEVDAALLASLGLGLGSALTVQDENGAYFPPGDWFLSA